MSSAACDRKTSGHLSPPSVSVVPSLGRPMKCRWVSFGPVTVITVTVCVTATLAVRGRPIALPRQHFKIPALVLEAGIVSGHDDLQDTLTRPVRVLCQLDHTVGE